MQKMRDFNGLEEAIFGTPCQVRLYSRRRPLPPPALPAQAVTISDYLRDLRRQPHRDSAAYPSRPRNAFVRLAATCCDL
jgi:hypothetical protein